MCVIRPDLFQAPNGLKPAAASSISAGSYKRLKLPGFEGGDKEGPTEILHNSSVWMFAGQDRPHSATRKA